MKNDNKFCVDAYDVRLSYYCLEAEKKDNGYSCLECEENYAIVENTVTKIKNCNERKNNLIYCLEGKYENK